MSPKIDDTLPGFIWILAKKFDFSMLSFQSFFAHLLINYFKICILKLFLCYSSAMSTHLQCYICVRRTFCVSIQQKLWILLVGSNQKITKFQPDPPIYWPELNLFGLFTSSKLIHNHMHCRLTWNGLKHLRRHIIAAIWWCFFSSLQEVKQRNEKRLGPFSFDGSPIERVNILRPSAGSSSSSPSSCPLALVDGVSSSTACALTLESSPLFK